ncbi:MAG TPA: beta-ketoacyl synthase N-terminal-like domain-containing protein, partial [Polyangiales bacterium]|nr:beta-ketoacyl synthase N-terminal-like domain-containing protein [Polyangiales bacterium]
MACRFPGAADLSAFWKLLQRGGDAISEMPPSRRHSREHAPQFGGFIEGIEQFDPAFFGISMREAARMDPQQRLFLEVAWEALEDAGIAPDSLAGSDSGVFAAVCGSDHALVHAHDLSRIDADFGTGHSASVVANRVSYFLDLHGPSLSFDSACASSLVALQAACRSLASGEIDLAIVGGVNAVLAPQPGLFLAHARALSPSGRCKTFDQSADGFVRSEGCGVIVLRAAPRARTERNRIYALVSGSAVAHGGASNGLMAPNGAAQTRVITRALSIAGIAPDALDFIEAHGVGARLADTVELRALRSLLETESRASTCWVGSVKTNLGHLEAAAGIASVIKTALALHHEEIPRHLHLNAPHGELAEGKALAVPRQNVPWRRSPRRRHAGVSTFGFGGSHAHVVLSEAPALSPAADGGRPLQLLTLSARTRDSLVQTASRFAAALHELPFGDAMFSAKVGRKHFAERKAFVAANASDMTKQLQAFAQADSAVETATPRPRLIALFTSHANPTPTHRGLSLYEHEPEFRRAFDRACE